MSDKMAKQTFIYSAIILVFIFTYHPHAYATSTSGYASATIMQSIELSELQDLQFGAVALQNGQSDVVTLSASGDANASTASLLSGSTSQSAIFTASGAPNAVDSLTFQNGFLTGAGSSMNVNNFTHSAGTSPQMDGSGALIFNVGADLEINEDQAAGNYSGTYQVTVNYQ